MNNNPNLQLMTYDKQDCLSAAQQTGQLDIVTSLMKAGIQLRPVSGSSGARFKLSKPKVI